MAVPEVAAGVLYGFRDVFSFVGVGWEMLTGWPEGGRRMAARVVAEDRTPFRNSAGILIAPELAFDEVERADVVIVGDFAIGWSDETRGRWPAAVGLAAAAAREGRAGLLGLHRLADARRGGAARRRGGDLPLGDAPT